MVEILSCPHGVKELETRYQCMGIFLSFGEVTMREQCASANEVLVPALMQIQYKDWLVTEGIAPECHEDRWIKYKNKEGKRGVK